MSRRVFADTSALYAVLAADDDNNAKAVAALRTLAQERARLTTTSYVLVECYALIGRRLGREAVARFRTDVAPLLGIIWVDDYLHERGLDLLLKDAPASLSLVDAVSFATMRRERLDEAFAFDKHFRDEGFEQV